MNIMHLRLAVVGGIVIVAFGLVSLLGYHHLPVLSFHRRAIDQLHLMAGVCGNLQRKKSFVEIRLSSARGRRRKF